MTNTILVTGATGNVGAEVVKVLPQTKQVRLAVRNIDSAKQVFGEALDYVRFDFMDTTTFAPAFSGIKSIFLVRPPAIADIEVFKPMIDSAKKANVQQIVFLSIQGVEKMSFVPHAKIEAVIRESGIGYTFLRAGFFMQNLIIEHLDEIRRDDEIFIPAGTSKTAFIDVRDIAEVGARTLIEDGHINQAYTLTGTQKLDYFEVAECFTEVLGRKITYANPSLLYFVWRMWRKGTPFGKVFIMGFLYTMTRFGQADDISLDAQNILGHAPISMQQFVIDYADDFQTTNHTD